MKQGILKDSAYLVEKESLIGSQNTKFIPSLVVGLKFIPSAW